MMDIHPTLNLETLAAQTIILAKRENRLDSQLDNADTDCVETDCRCLYCHETYNSCVCEL